MTMPRLAETYKTLAFEGAQAFYNGSLTAQIVKDIQKAGEWATLGALGEELHRGVPELRPRGLGSSGNDWAESWALRDHLDSEGHRCVCSQ